ncbi:hypothetical protein IB233_03110 [Comamonas sp. CMM01]|uniref:hypothetical protein n=1 Tax=Comamonas sp. CMM01 TaxID=2769280 RepID=UPI00177EFDF7|nr:hypothetical protein [Comamonas sp. CMM01]MBD9530622.1 hypothetical protein [Comamonas sp. CMM01]
MKEIFESIDNAVAQISSYSEEITKGLGNKPVTQKLREAIDSLNAHQGQYEAAVDLGDADKIINEAKLVGVYGQLVSQSLDAMGGVAKEVALISTDLQKKSRELRRIAENNPLVLKPLGEASESKDTESQTRLALQAQSQRRARQLAEDLDRQELRIQSLHKELKNRFQPLDDRLSQLDVLAAQQVKNIEDAYSAATTTLLEKQKEVDNILGVISGTAVASGYHENSVSERIMADWLRYASLFCMLVITILLTYTFWETTQDTFSWEKSAFRILAAVFLSAPAAYLARESSKHRHQQYAHLQTSLDLKAVSPYVASLPEEIQHKIKAEVASRVFSGRDFSKLADNEFPINAQEIVAKVIEKIDFSKNEKNA